MTNLTKKQIEIKNEVNDWCKEAQKLSELLKKSEKIDPDEIGEICRILYKNIPEISEFYDSLDSLDGLSFCCIAINKLIKHVDLVWRSYCVNGSAIYSLRCMHDYAITILFRRKVVILERYCGLTQDYFDGEENE